MNKETMNNRREEINQKITALRKESQLISELRESMKVSALENIFSSVELMEGTELAINFRNVQLINNETGFDLAKLSIDSDFIDFSSMKKKTVVNFQFNGGRTEEVKFLPSMAEFINVASKNEELIIQEFDKASKFMSGVNDELREDIRILDREDSDIRFDMIKKVEDTILDQMQSEKGFDLVATRKDDDEKFPFISRDGLQVSFDFKVNQVSNVKILSMTKSGKTATVEITQIFNERVSSFTEKVRMSNLKQLISSQRRKLEDVEKGVMVFA